MRVAVIGAGQFGRNHVRVVAQSPRAELAAVIDRDADRARQAAAEFCPSAAVLTDYREAARVADAAVVAAPTSAHAEIGCALMEQGLDVLVEKPLAATVAEAEQLTDTARRTGRILQAGHLERFNPAVQALRRVVTLPLFFEIHRLSVFSPRSLDVDVILDLMIHDLDIVLDLVGGEPAEIHAAGISILSEKVDIANVRLQFPGGCTANLTASRVSTERVRKLRLFQPREYISLDYTRQHAVRFQVDEQRQISYAELPAARAEPLQAQWEAFVDAVERRSPPLVDGGAAARALRVAQAIIDKIEMHRKIVEETVRRRRSPSGNEA
jgi:predicted dehydrogenase